jgi:thiamine-phosphate pyrophosphorylase
MRVDDIRKVLRFYFISDDHAPNLKPLDQVKIAIRAGATIIQYRNKLFDLGCFEEVVAIKDYCSQSAVPFIVNDDVLLAKAVAADGVHLGREDAASAVARRLLGPEAFIGASIHDLIEMRTTDLSNCDYIGTGPVFPTQTKVDASRVRGLPNLQAVAQESSLPVVAIGGIDREHAEACFRHGAAGVAVISAITRAKDPVQAAREFGRTCGCRPRLDL